MEHERKGTAIDDYQSYHELFDGEDFYIGEYENEDDDYENISGKAKKILAYKSGFEAGYQGKYWKGPWEYVTKITGGGNRLFKIFKRAYRKGEKKRQYKSDHGPAVRKAIAILKQTL